MKTIKLIGSILLTIVIIGTMLYIAIVNNQSSRQSTSQFTNIVGHTHNKNNQKE